MGTSAIRRAHAGSALLLLCLALCPAAAAAPAHLDLWHTYAADGVEEKLFLEAVEGFRAARPGIEVRAARIPYLQNQQQFVNAAQGGEAPDVLRLSDTELGKIGHVSVSGLPLLEDLRVHLTPAERGRFAPRALAAMRYGPPLLALPASQGCVSLLYNKRLFAAAGVPPPQDDWTTDDLLAAAKALTDGDVEGLAIPLNWAYWYIPFQTGFGGRPFDGQGRPSLDSPGSAAGLDWLLDLARKHGVAGAGTDIEAVSTRFARGRAAMTIDGPWNWHRYEEAGVALGQALLPTVADTGQRLGPLLSYFGWAVAKQSENKVAAAELALWLASSTVQKSYALATYALPVRPALAADPSLAGHPVLAGFLKQAQHGVTVPTSHYTALAFQQLDTAIEMTRAGKMPAAEALAAANAEVLRAGR